MVRKHLTVKQWLHVINLYKTKPLQEACAYYFKCQGIDASLMFGAPSYQLSRRIMQKTLAYENEGVKSLVRKKGNSYGKNKNS